MALPHYKSTTRRELIAFDLRHGLPTALSVLGEHLSATQRARVLSRYMWLSVARDPLKGIDEGNWPRDKERLVRHQLSAALLLDDALMPEVDERQRLLILKEVISRTGAKFIQKILPLPKTSQWQQADESERNGFLKAAMNRFFNAEIDTYYARSQWLGFDVNRCRFVMIVHQLDRAYLAPLFCAADSVFFEQPEAPVRLERTQTIASGGTCCDFRFHFKEEEQESSP